MEAREQTGTGRRAWAAYNIIEREGLKSAIWSRVGTAFINKDGSFNIILDAMPVGGKIHVREDDRDREKPARPARRGALGQAADEAEA